MRRKTGELLDQLRRSRGRPPIGLDHLRALLADAHELGDAGFLEQVEQRWSPAPPGAARRAHPLQEAFLRAEQRAWFPVRREFVDAVVEAAVAAHGASFTLPARHRTMPGLLRAYGERLSQADLAELLRAVGERHAHTR